MVKAYYIYIINIYIFTTSCRTTWKVFSKMQGWRVAVVGALGRLLRQCPALAEVHFRVTIGYPPREENFEPKELFTAAGLAGLREGLGEAAGRPFGPKGGRRAPPLAQMEAAGRPIWTSKVTTCG